MIYENKALQKTCPIRSDGNDPEVNCIGSQCMAWRWAFNQDNKGFCVLLSTQMTIREKSKREDYNG